MGKTDSALAVINVLLAALSLAEEFRINYQRVAALKAQARAQGRDDLTADERQALLDEAQAAIDRL